VIWQSPQKVDDPWGLLEAGRSAVSALLMQLELEFGPRLLASRLAEEVGEVFDDWHWNRRAFTGTAHAESQAALITITGQEFVDRCKPLIEQNQALSDQERGRLRLAARWYWIAQEELDATLRFLELWMVVETLEMPSSHIKPVVARAALLLGSEAVELKGSIGRLFGIRGNLVHGKARGVSASDMRAVEALARLLLSGRCGGLRSSQLDETRELLLRVGTQEHTDD
jgi:hypothetical protein